MSNWRFYYIDHNGDTIYDQSPFSVKRRHY